jgi:hypothetical protein
MGDRHSKLDKHNFTGLFHGYTSTDQNIRYLDLNSGNTKTCHHATFDEAWYLQDIRKPAAQLLYQLGLKDDHSFSTCPPDGPFAVAHYPPISAPTLALSDTVWLACNTCHSDLPRNHPDQTRRSTQSLDLHIWGLVLHPVPATLLPPCPMGSR